MTNSNSTNPSNNPSAPLSANQQQTQTQNQGQKIKLDKKFIKNFYLVVQIVHFALFQNHRLHGMTI